MSTRFQMPPPCTSASYVLCGCTDTSACTRANMKHTFAPLHTKVKHPQTALFVLSIPLKVHRRRRRDRLRMLFQPFSFLDNLITSDRGDAARSALVQGHSLLGPWQRRCAQRRGGGAAITYPPRCNLIADP